MRISPEFEIAAYGLGEAGVIRLSLNRDDIGGEPYVAIKQGDQLITLDPSALAELAGRLAGMYALAGSK